MSYTPHQYIDRRTASVVTEALFADRILSFIFSREREMPARLYDALTSARASSILGYLNFDLVMGSRKAGARRLVRRLHVDLDECLDGPAFLDTPRKVFERRIRYWERRPMTDDPAAIVSPADAKVVLGSFQETSSLYIKDKFFSFEELLGRDRGTWLDAFRDGDFAVFRLTPDKYHYNHSPVSGRVLDIYEVPGRYNSCNPGAAVALATPYSKNKRVVTIIDTDVEGGTGAGLVALVEVVALMIGDIIQCYSEERYDEPQDVTPGLFIRKGRPKSLYRPGSSTDILVFQRSRVEFSPDLILNMHRSDALSRYTLGFGLPLVETDLKVRAKIGRAVTTP